MQSINSLRHALLAGAALIFVSIVGSGAARAEAWTIDYTTTAGTNAHLDVITDNTLSNGATNVIGVSGERNGVAVTALSSYASSDQLLFEVDPYVDFSGLSFTTTGGNDYNLFTNNGYFEVYSGTDPVGYAQNGVGIATIKVTDVPEPMSMALLGVGLLGIGMTMRRKAPGGSDAASA